MKHAVRWDDLEHLEPHAWVSSLKCVLLPSWRGDLGVDPSGRPPRSTAPSPGRDVNAGRRCAASAATAEEMRDSLVGDETLNKHGVLTSKHPIEHGKVKNWCDTEDASGRTTDTVMTSGDGVSHTVRTYEVYAMHQAILRLVGRDPTEYLTKSLTEQRFSFTVGRDIVWDVKEKRCYLAFDHDTALKSIAAFPKQKTYALPDRNIISVGAGRFHCFEIWFLPSFSGKEACGVNDTLSSTS